MFAKQFKELIDKRGLTQRAVAERPIRKTPMPCSTLHSFSNWR